VALVWIDTVNPSLGRVHEGIGILGSGYGAAQAAIVAPRVDAVRLERRPPARRAPRW
jgi:hypothetical protein